VQWFTEISEPGREAKRRVEGDIRGLLIVVGDMLLSLRSSLKPHPISPKLFS